MYALYLTAEGPLSNLVEISEQLMGRPYPSLVFHLSLTADDDQTEFLSRFAHDLHAVTGDEIAFMPLVDLFKTRAQNDFRDRRSPGEALTVSDLATHFNENGESWAFNSRLATRAADLFAVPRSEIPCWIFVDVVRDNEIQAFPAPASPVEFEVFRRTCDRFNNMISESPARRLFDRFQKTADHLAKTAEAISSFQDEYELQKDRPTIQERYRCREQWNEAVANALADYDGLPCLADARMWTNDLVAKARQIGSPYNVFPSDARKSGHGHIKNLPPHLTKQLKPVFAPLRRLDDHEKLLALYRRQQLAHSESWQDVRTEFLHIPPLADLYEEECRSHGRAVRRFGRRHTLRTAVEDARRILDAFNSIRNPI